MSHLILTSLKVYNGQRCLNDDQITGIFQNSLHHAKQQAEGAVPGFGGLCSNVQNVMTDMAYNLGGSGLSSFHTFLGRVNQHDWKGAASDLRGTLWCRQVGSRCTRNSNIIEQGCPEQPQSQGFLSSLSGAFHNAYNFFFGP